MSNQSRERLGADDPLHEGPSDQHRLYDQIATGNKLYPRRSRDAIANFRGGLRVAFINNPGLRDEIAAIFGPKPKK